MAKSTFTYSTEQTNLRNCQNRINGLTSSVKSGLPYQLELDRMIKAREEIISRMSETDLAAMQAHENRVLSPAEKAAEAKALADAMSENRDKPSI